MRASSLLVVLLLLIGCGDSKKDNSTGSKDIGDSTNTKNTGSKNTNNTNSPSSKTPGNNGPNGKLVKQKPKVEPLPQKEVKVAAKGYFSRLPKKFDKLKIQSLAGPFKLPEEVETQHEDLEKIQGYYVTFSWQNAFLTTQIEENWFIIAGLRDGETTVKTHFPPSEIEKNLGADWKEENPPKSAP